MEISEILEYYANQDEDVYMYTGPIDAGLQALREKIFLHKNKRGTASLFIATLGGDPDWAYRLVSSLRKYYKKINIVVAGYCKSAGTLIALGADNLRFHRYGELGPLDVQMQKKDNMVVFNSGLDVFEAISVIDTSSKDYFNKIFFDIMVRSNGAIPTATIAQIATDLTTGIYSSIASKIDPVELGEKKRAINIAHAYGKKLDDISQSHNLKPNTLDKIIGEYPSHGFVIDQKQAEKLFNNVEDMNEYDYLVYQLFSQKFALPLRETFICDLSDLVQLDNMENVNGCEQTTKTSTPSLESRAKKGISKKKRAA